AVGLAGFLGKLDAGQQSIASLVPLHPCHPVFKDVHMHLGLWKLKCFTCSFRDCLERGVFSELVLYYCCEVLFVVEGSEACFDYLCCFFEHADLFLGHVPDASDEKPWSREWLPFRQFAWKVEVTSESSHLVLVEVG